MAEADVNIRTRSNPDCRFCGSTGQILYTGLRDKLFSAPGTWQLRQCTRPDCGLVWPDPVAIDEDLALAYHNYYTPAEPAPGLGKMWRPVLSGGYRFLVGIPAARTGLRRERYRFRHLFLDDLPPGRVFDVGCGDGQFLHLLSQLGWQGTGVDFDAAAIAAGRQKFGLDLKASDFQSCIVEDEAFDAVTLSHVIEQMPDPLACLEKCRQMLKPGGRLVVTTPNVRSLGHKRFKQAWRGLEPPRHLQIFSPSLLGKCARRAGLQVVLTGSTAANADLVANTSLALEKAPADASGIGCRWRFRYALQSAVFQYREHSDRRRNPDAGEDAFLIARRA
jgi:SAM-dependent methyltransferase